MCTVRLWWDFKAALQWHSSHLGSRGLNRARLIGGEGEAGPGIVGTHTVPMSHCTVQHGKRRRHKGVSCKKYPLWSWSMERATELSGTFWRAKSRGSRRSTAAVELNGSVNEATSIVGKGLVHSHGCTGRAKGAAPRTKKGAGMNRWMAHTVHCLPSKLGMGGVCLNIHSCRHIHVCMHNLL